MKMIWPAKHAKNSKRDKLQFLNRRAICLGLISKIFRWRFLRYL
jgi:hypothetical protein